MLNHSLFSNWLHENGMKTDKKDETTRDIICLDFQFGLRSYKEELEHLKKMRKDAKDNEEKLEKVNELEEKVSNYAIVYL